MVNLNIKLNKKYIIPKIELLIKIFVSVLIVNYMVAPFVFDNLTILNNLNLFWKTFVTSFLAIYLALIFEIKLFGREYF